MCQNNSFILIDEKNFIFRILYALNDFVKFPVYLKFNNIIFRYSEKNGTVDEENYNLINWAICNR